MPEQILFGRLGNKTNDIKYFKQFLPLDSKIIVEPFGGCFALSRIVYSDGKYKKYVNDTDELLFNIYTNPEGYNEMNIKLNTLAQNCKNECGNVKFEKFIEELEKIKINLDEKMLEYWKMEKIVRGRMVKCVKEINNQKMIDIMKTINFSNTNYLECINKFKGNKDAFIFLDPPYLFSDNSQYSQQKRKEGMDMTDMLIEIKSILEDKATKAKIMLIINDMKIIRWLYSGFIKGEYLKKFGLSNRIEKLLIITNF